MIRVVIYRYSAEAMDTDRNTKKETQQCQKQAKIS